MKSNNNIYSFFIALALLFWNPIGYFLIYGNKISFSIKLNNFFFWFYSIVFLVGILSIFLIQKNKLNEIIKKTIFSIAFTGILFVALVMLDRIVGLTLKKETKQVQRQEGLIFPPNTQVRYKTTEFDYMAYINGLGLRDREINIKKGNKYRILCFGDSFTFGWGVDVEDSWPKKLEQLLHDKGYNNIEVINCGQGGTYTTTYKNYLARAVPLLKPDLVLIGVFQGDDLSQLFENNHLPHSKSNIQTISIYGKRIINIYLKASFGNILSLAGNKKSKTSEATSFWEEYSNEIINGFSQEQEFRFNALEDTVQNLFKSGNLGPNLLHYYIDYPENLAVFNNPNNQETIFSIKEMDKDIKNMKAICQRNNSKLVFINLPSHHFTGHKVIMTPSDSLNIFFKNNNKIDSIYNSIATSNGLDYIQLTEPFSLLENKTKYFFLFDGHPNENGYSEIANYIGHQLIEKKILNFK